MRMFATRMPAPDWAITWFAVWTTPMGWSLSTPQIARGNIGAKAAGSDPVRTTRVITEDGYKARRPGVHISAGQTSLSRHRLHPRFHSNPAGPTHWCRAECAYRWNPHSGSNVEQMLGLRGLPAAPARCRKIRNCGRESAGCPACEDNQG